MSNIVTGNFGQVPAVLQNAPAGVFGDMANGITSGFATVRYKGKTWKVKYQGNEHLWRGQDGQPTQSVEVVIINAASHISKQWYAGGFVEGAEVGAPACWSVNGVAPDPAAPQKQHTSCVSCPKNVWGSAVGSKGKACSDRRRLAIMPASMLMQGLESPFGGPLLLTVPPTSLKDLAAFQRQAQSLGFPYYGIVTRIGFDYNVAYPKLVFSAVRALTDDEARMVIELATDDYTQRMLAAAVDEEVKHDDDQPSAAGFFEQGAQKPAAGIAPATVQPAPAPASAPAAAPAQAPVNDPFNAKPRAPASDPFLTPEMGGPPAQAPAAAPAPAPRKARTAKPVEAPPAAEPPADLEAALDAVFR